MQISDDLIQYITRELMKRLSFPEKPLLRLVGRREDLSTPALARIQENFELAEDRDGAENSPSDAAVLITRLSIQALVRVAEGDEGCTAEGRALLGALLNGRPVAALREGLVWRHYLATAPKSLLNRYAQCESLLQSYGLKLVGEDEVCAALLDRRPAAAPAEARPQQPEPVCAKPRGGRRVISEAELRRECPEAKGFGQSLRLGPGDLMTPLAQDYARSMRIDLVRD